MGSTELEYVQHVATILRRSSWRLRHDDSGTTWIETVNQELGVKPMCNLNLATLRCLTSFNSAIGVEGREG